MRSANALESLLFVRSPAHTDVYVDGTASESLPFSQTSSGALVAAPSCLFVPDALKLVRASLLLAQP